MLLCIFFKKKKKSCGNIEVNIVKLEKGWHNILMVSNMVLFLKVGAEWAVLRNTECGCGRRDECFDSGREGSVFCVLERRKDADLLPLPFPLLLFFITSAGRFIYLVVEEDCLWPVLVHQ